MGKQAICPIHQAKVFNVQKLQSLEDQPELFNKKCRHCLKIKEQLIFVKMKFNDQNKTGNTQDNLSKFN